MQLFTERFWEAISAIGQIVGALAVVISLIYLATEVRSNARATRLAATRSTLDSLYRLIQQITEHPDLAELRSRGFDDFESLEGTDRARFFSYMHGLFRNMEDVYYLHLRGHLDPHFWRGLEAVMRDSQYKTWSSGLVAFILALFRWGGVCEVHQSATADS